MPKVTIDVPESAFHRLSAWVAGEEELMKSFIISAIWGRLNKLSDLEDPVGWKKREKFRDRKEQGSGIPNPEEVD